MNAILTDEKELAQTKDREGDNIRVDVLKAPSGMYVAVLSLNYDGDCGGYSLRWAETFANKQVAFAAASAEADKMVAQSWEQRRAERQVEMSATLQHWTPMAGAASNETETKGWTRVYVDDQGVETTMSIYALPGGNAWHAEYSAGDYGHRTIEVKNIYMPDLLDLLKEIQMTLESRGYTPKSVDEGESETEINGT